MQKLNLLILVLGVFFASCGEDDLQLIGDINCDVTEVVDEDQFSNESSDEFDINNIEINDDCLSIEFGAAGNSGDTWE